MKSNIKLTIICAVVLVFLTVCHQNQQNSESQPMELGPEISGSWPAWESYDAAGWSPEKYNE